METSLAVSLLFKQKLHPLNMSSKHGRDIDREHTEREGLAYGGRATPATPGLPLQPGPEPHGWRGCRPFPLPSRVFLSQTLLLLTCWASGPILPVCSLVFSGSLIRVHALEESLDFFLSGLQPISLILSPYF